MRIGDKVRLLRGTEEGRIVNIKNNKIVEIEIEDGFTIPALINEVVVISSMEAEVFKPEEPESNEPLVNKRNQDFISEGIYLGFKEAKEQKFEAFIINQTSNTILFSVSQYDKKIIIGKAFGICEQYDAKEIGSFTSSIFNESKRILVQLIIHEGESRLKRPPQTFEEHISKDQLKELTYLSSLSSEVALIKLGEKLSIKIDPRELQNTDEAIKIAKTIVAQDSKHIESVAFLATLYMRDKKNKEAISLLDTALNNNQNNESLNKLLALVLVANKDYGRAEIIYKDFLERNPDNSSSYNNLAAFYNQTDDKVKAEETLRASIDNDPDNEDRILTLIKYIREIKGDDEAIKELKTFIASNNGLGKLRTALAELYILKG